MKTITQSSRRRPGYTEQMLQSLAVAMRPGWDRFGAFIDGPGGEVGGMWKLIKTCAPKDIKVSITASQENLGVDANTRAALDWAFIDQQSDFNLHIEDDTVLSRDALELCDWFYTHSKRDDYACLSLHSHSKDLSHPLDLVEHFGFGAWGWAMTRKAWLRWFAPEWNAKHHLHPRGWDWSMGLTIQRHGLKTLHPVLSRVRNIGREGGTYETPSHWDEWTKGLVQSPGGLGTEFGITNRLPGDFAFHPEPWVIAEMEAERKAKS